MQIQSRRGMISMNIYWHDEYRFLAEHVHLKYSGIEADILRRVYVHDLIAGR